MTTSDDGPLAKSDLYYADKYKLSPHGVFQFQDATYGVTFTHEDGVLRCLDMMMGLPDKPATPRFALRPEGYQEKRPEWPVSVLRFDYDLDHHVAAAVVLALDKDANTHPWMSHGTARRDDIELTHSTWSPEDNQFPPESFITITELRDVVTQWAFGDLLPPPAIHWTAVNHDDVGW